MRIPETNVTGGGTDPMVDALAAGWDIQKSVIAGPWQQTDEDTVVRAASAVLRELSLEECRQTESNEAGGEISFALADDATIRKLNHDYRRKDKPTNVLSFPNEDPPMPGMPRLLGDVILSYETCMREADEAGRPFAEHLSHLTVHGVLHLFGYDHIEPEDATEMEAMEIRILKGIGIADPYAGFELVE